MSERSGRVEHGGEVYSLARGLGIAPEKLLDFSSNANIFAEPLTARLVTETPYPFLHYPDTRAQALSEAIAWHEGVASDRILPGNGAAELIWLFMQAMNPRRVLFLGPVFSEYVAACKALGIQYEILTPPAENGFVCGPEEYSRLWESDADLVMICTPNNPAAVTYQDIHSILAMVRAPRVFIDNSYREFLFGSEAYTENTFIAYLSVLRPGVSLFTLNSFTKFYCCPGIRLGYLMGDRIQLERLAVRRPSWMISPFAQIMGETFLAHIDAYRECLAPLYEAVAYAGRELRQLACMNAGKVFEGPGFLCCGLQPGFSARKVQMALVSHCVVVRNCDTIPGMEKGFIRIQARPAADVERLVRAIECAAVTCHR